MTYQPMRLTGHEVLYNSPILLNDASVLDFWKWAFSNLCANNIRGIFAEWLVARLLDLHQPLRDSWVEWDLTTPEGVKIEVKTSAYVQAWQQKQPSKIVFGGLRGRRLDAATNTYATTATYNADLYVFCIQVEQDVQKWDALDLGQWRFYMLTREQVMHLNCTSISLATLKTVSQQLTAAEFREQARAMIQTIIRI